MQRKLKIYATIFVSLIIFVLLIVFDYYDFQHTVVIHLIDILIILNVLWFKKYSLIIIPGIISTHIILDTIAMSAFPWEAVLESSAQMVFTLILYWIVSKREESNRQLSEIIHATNVGTWQWNLKTNEIQINDLWAEMLGYTLSELQPINIHTWEKLTHPEDLKDAYEIIEKVVSGTLDFYEVDSRIKHKDGYYMWIHDRGKVTRYTPKGEPLIMSGTHTDITSRKKLAIQETYYTKLLNYIINHMNSGIAVYDKDLNYIYVSHNYIDQFKLKDGNIIGKHHYEVFPDMPEKWKKVHQRSLKGEVLSSPRDTYPRADGTTDYTRWESRPWYDDKGEIGGIIVYSEVINNQIKIEQDLENKVKELYIQKEEIEATLLAIGDGVISTDAKGKIQAFNDAASKLTGYTKEEAYEADFDLLFKIIHEKTKEPIQSPIKQVLNSGKTLVLSNHVMLIDKLGGKHLIENSASPIYNEKNELTGVILVFRDVTEKKYKQREIEYLSAHDYLTGLYNRRFFAEELLQNDNKETYPLGLLMIDLNGLKILNDAYGHNIGDLALRQVAKGLLEVINNQGTVSRIGGDEFTVILPNTSNEKIHSLIDKLHIRIKEVKINNASLSIAIGYAIRHDDNDEIASFLKKAEDMMYKLKLVEGASARNHTIKAILETLNEKHELERRHSEQVSEISYLIGKGLQLSKESLKELKLSGMFHDIGKISIPDIVLNKPSSLTKEEYEIIKTHTTNGYQILRAADQYSDFAEHALYHHERYDGTGYPEGLKGKEIPLFARIISVADAFEAMTSDRPYRKAMSFEEAVDELKKYKGTQFDPQIVDAFLANALPKIQPH
jgi:diguanylate cyclase (GGDEF)-like protein/PAS domain S-box-containing protein